MVAGLTEGLGASLQSYLEGETELIFAPKVLCIESTNRCNFSCGHCYSSRSPTDITPSEFEQILGLNQDVLSGQSIWLHYSGEPLLHQKLERLIETSALYDVAPMLSTNGSLMTIEKSGAILKTPLCMIVFSLDAFYEDTFQKIRRNHLFNLIKANTLNFINAREKSRNSHLHIQVQLVRTIQGPEEISRFVEFWQQSGVDSILLKKYSERAGRVRWKNIMPPTSPSFRAVRGPCFDPWHNLIILSDLSVVPCCADFGAELAIGNIRNKRIQDIWNSTKMVKLRRSHIDQFPLPSLCLGCNEYRSGNSQQSLSTFVETNVSDWQRFAEDTRSILIKCNNKIESFT